MTATALTEQPGRVIYPVLPQAAGSRCSYCWQPGPSALCADPYGEGLRRLCGPCDRALRIGRPVDLSDAQKAEAWEWLARQYVNQRAGEDTGITELHIDWALAALTPPGLSPQAGWERFECLCEDLLAWQAAEDGDVDYGSLEPQWRDAVFYTNHLRGGVDDAVHRLIGRTR